MAGLFGGPDKPQYVDPTGHAVATQASGGGFLGVFPGSPDYSTPTVPTVPTPSKPDPVTPGSEGAAIEVSIRIPGLLSLQGALTIPPWVKDQAPALAPLVLRILSQRIDAEMRREARQPSDPGAGECDPSELGYGPSEVEARVWERE
jgi:hypothetical protein